jgi:hypothetical protein
MSAPEYYLRLFDVKKYREIQPIIEGILRHDAKAEQVISLIKAAQQVVQTDDFKKYNSDLFVDSSNWHLCSELEMIENNGILAWFKEIKRGKYINSLEPIINRICCPKYQFSTEDLSEGEILGTNIDYSYLVRQYDIDDLKLRELIYREILLDKSNLIETFPFHSYYGSEKTFFYDRQYLVELTQAVNEDIDALSRSDINLDKYSSQYHLGVIAKFLKLYDDLKFLLELANLSEDYTLLYQNYM